jgi:hypothetical protein
MCAELENVNLILERNRNSQSGRTVQPLRKVKPKEDEGAKPRFDLNRLEPQPHGFRRGLVMDAPLGLKN